MNSKTTYRVTGELANLIHESGKTGEILEKAKFQADKWRQAERDAEKTHKEVLRKIHSLLTIPSGELVLVEEHGVLYLLRKWNEHTSVEKIEINRYGR